MDELGESKSMSGTLGAARMAQEAGVRKLVLNHIGPPLGQPGAMMKAFRDISEIYDGEVVLSEELMRVPIGDPQRSLQVWSGVERARV